MYVTEAQLAASDGSSLVGFFQTGMGAVVRSVEDRLRDAVLATDYGADPTGGMDSTTALQDALATGRNVVFPDGNYRCQGIEVDTDYQCLIGLGKVQIIKNANGTLIELKKRGNKCIGITFDGEGTTYSGDNIVCSGDEAQFVGCDSLDARYRALKGSGTATAVFGGLWQVSTAYASAGYEFEFDGSGNQYNVLIGIGTSQPSGGILVSGGASLAVSDSQFGKLATRTDGGIRCTGNRIGGAVTIYGSFASFDGNNFADTSITIGDGTNGISGIRWGPTNIVANDTNFTISALVSRSSFYLHQVYGTQGATVTINSRDNAIWHPRIAFTPQFLASGSPSVGSGSRIGFYSRAGYDVFVDFRIAFGTGMNFGSGNARVQLPFASVARVIGRAFADVAGTHYNLLLNIGASDDDAYIQLNQSTVTPATGSVPGPWASGSYIEGSIAYTAAP
ncbi:glycosyl hydrolase family 28-related protein [Sphingosinicella sp. LHD-64]|uniref:glycosyl hydrolase family 28-related protein n=1 Tax=Sphingosinicella sp. LHD-64 TaxID=3072139 RepID=UPI00280EDB5C|nr:glycosyl hydrolase family 28-related protein [Sphingosinicella sp. LHD-64]MDQ8755699.1 glycosyl hydrolase family 28-related protein [Sphingosinicella sp. LHD-64]